MTQPLPCPRLEAEFNRMFAAMPKPEAPVPMDDFAAETVRQQFPNDTARHDFYDQQAERLEMEMQG